MPAHRITKWLTAASPPHLTTLSDTCPIGRPGPQAYPPPPPSAYPQYGVPPVGYAAPQQTNVSGLVLTIISGLLVFSCYFTLIGLPSFIIGIIAMTKQNTDWEGSRRLARIGWIVLGSLFALAILAVIAFIVIGVATDTSQY